MRFGFSDSLGRKADVTPTGSLGTLAAQAFDQLWELRKKRPDYDHVSADFEADGQKYRLEISEHSNPQVLIIRPMSVGEAATACFTQLKTVREQFPELDSVNYEIMVDKRHFKVEVTILLPGRVT